MSETNPTPQVGQIWADNDERSTGSGEFEIIDVLENTVRVKRTSGIHTQISKKRLAEGGARGYRYIGMSR